MQGWIATPLVECDYRHVMSVSCCLLRLSGPDLIELDRRLTEDKTAADAFLQHDQRSESTGNLEQGWYGLHFLLTGFDIYESKGEPPLNFIATGDRNYTATPEFLGGHLLEPSTVQRASAALSALTRSDLKKHYNPAQFRAKDVYPAIWSDEEADDSFDFLMQSFDEAQRLLAAAAAAQEPVVVYFV
jgi:hypothetical protein